MLTVTLFFVGAFTEVSRFRIDTTTLRLFFVEVFVVNYVRGPANFPVTFGLF